MLHAGVGLRSTASVAIGREGHSGHHHNRRNVSGRSCCRYGRRCTSLRSARFVTHGSRKTTHASSMVRSANGSTSYERIRRLKNPKVPASDQALWRMVHRVCKRAGIRDLSPHQLRHGFANRFLRESDKDVVALQALVGHSRPDTTQLYTDEIEIDELAVAAPRQRSKPGTHKRRLIWRRLRWLSQLRCKSRMEAAGIEPRPRTPG